MIGISQVPAERLEISFSENAKRAMELISEDERKEKIVEEKPVDPTRVLFKKIAMLKNLAHKPILDRDDLVS